MQASIGWSPPTGALGSLLASASERVGQLRPLAGQLGDAAAAAPRRPSFSAALRGGSAVGLIAEIKRRSPSKGAIAPGLSAADQAAAYAKGGAAAISVLTEPLQFGGALVDLDAALPAGVPLLRKDFIVDRLQLLEAVIHGASAALLISRAMPAERLAELHADGLALGLELLVEVHDEGEMAAAIAAGYPAVGVNNRDLQTLKIDIAVCARLVPTIPAGVIAVYESGIKTRADVDQAAALGADAVLVGSALSASGAAEQRVRDLTGVARRARRGG